jgi:hypothetical protein
MVHKIVSLKNLTPFREGFPYEEKERESLFNPYIIERAKNNHQKAKMLRVEVSQVVSIPCVTCFESFIEQPINSWLHHIRQYEWPVPL